MALVIIAMVPATGSLAVAVIVPLAWALTAACYGMFWNGIVRLFLTTISIGLASWVISTVRSDNWEPLILLIAALLALGVLGQDSIYILALELDDLRTREAERAIITERQRFASDLHDIQGQHLSLITVEAELVSRLIERAEYPAAIYHAGRVQTIALEALDEMHQVVYANREVHLDDEITKANRVLQSAGISITQEIKDISELSSEADRLLGLTVREGVTNILKHTQAQACSILIQQEHRNGQDGISLIVTDSDASGTPMPTFANVESGTGLQMLTKRYRKLGGTLEFIQDGGGQLVGWIPNMNGGQNEND
ncbi:sensor histidine kinase [Rothia nasimurium]|uniref:sensor histidine kinase n=1 Tax=Rothia nasimurium TaxID=85336 RepID=UPI00162608EA|nr:histidine kinase [Rothia nasimurium]